MADNWYYTLTLCIFFSYKCQINQIHLNLVTINILLFLNYYYYFNNFSSCIVTLIFPPLSICPLGGLCILVAQWDYIRMTLFILCPAIQSDSVSHPFGCPCYLSCPHETHHEKSVLQTNGEQRVNRFAYLTHRCSDSTPAGHLPAPQDLSGRSCPPVRLWFYVLSSRPFSLFHWFGANADFQMVISSIGEFLTTKHWNMGWKK